MSEAIEMREGLILGVLFVHVGVRYFKKAIEIRRAQQKQQEE